MMQKFPKYGKITNIHIHELIFIYYSFIIKFCVKTFF